MAKIINLLYNHKMLYNVHLRRLLGHSSKLIGVCQNGGNSHYSSITNAQNLKVVKVDNSSGQYDMLFKGMETEFPCTSIGPGSGPEPEYFKVVSGYQTFCHEQPFHMRYNKAVLPKIDIAYETWGELNESRDNGVIINAGLSASSHARSHPENEHPGWWEKFVGPGCAIDTEKYFVICTNTLGGCYGSTGPSSINPASDKPYGATFPVMSLDDVVRAQFLLLDHLGIDKLHASVGSSLGGMCSLLATVLFPHRISRTVCISSCAQTPPSTIALRYIARKMIMTDPNWNQGNYYDSAYPLNGMRMAREINTLTYRSGPEWNQRFGRHKLDESSEPTLCPTFLVESYLEHQGNTFSVKYDPNSLLYLSKAMDLFDVADGFSSLEDALSNVKCPVLVIGVQSDILFPIWQQRDLARVLKETGNTSVTFYELNSIYGHDTFLLDLNGVGAAVKGFLDTHQRETGNLSKNA